VPRALGVGYDAIDDALAGRLALATLAALAIGKLVVWWLALASGTSGGTLAPILLISASTGGLVGQLAHDALPGAGISPGAFALVAVAATFGAATRAPFASIVFVFELTRDYDAVLPLMLATVLADLVARSLLRDSLMTERLTRRGLRVPEGYYPDVLTTTAVATVMTREVASLPASAPVALAIERLRTGAGPGSHSAYPVVDDDGRCVGIVTRHGGARRHGGRRPGRHARRAGRHLHPDRRAARPRPPAPGRAAPAGLAPPPGGVGDGLRVPGTEREV
jgi:chloride channel protein, CIC family